MTSVHMIVLLKNSCSEHVNVVTSEAEVGTGAVTDHGSVYTSGLTESERRAGEGERTGMVAVSVDDIKNERRTTLAAAARAQEVGSVGATDSSHPIHALISGTMSYFLLLLDFRLFTICIE